ncbi:hypothetical protein PILCRDRAFT_16752, partial [Piloderma croceum F 1598]
DDFVKELEEDPPNPWDLPDDEEDLETEGLTEDEAASRTQRYDKLRKELSQWYRREYKCPKATLSSSTNGANPFISMLNAHKEKMPRKRTPFHHYFKLHYKMHIKTEYTCRFQLARAEYNTATDVERQEKGLKNPIAVTVRSKKWRDRSAKALAGLTWPLHDPVGYSEAEKSVIEYGRANFPLNERMQHALPVESQSGQNTMPTGVASPDMMPDRSPSPPQTLLSPHSVSPSPSRSRSPPPPPHSLVIQPLAHRSPSPVGAASTPVSPVTLPWTNERNTTPPVSPPHCEITIVPRPLPDYADWPADLMGRYKFLTEKPGAKEATVRDWGDEWLDCVEMYMSFQSISGFQASHNDGTHLLTY